MELYELADAVADEPSFLRFVKALTADRQHGVEKERVSPSSSYGPGANGWENDTIEDFLESAAAWAEDTGFGQSQGLPNNPWRRFAAFLYGGKIYE